MSDKVCFYEAEDEFGELSNFSNHQVEINGTVYKTSEHYYQSCKVSDNDYRLKIMNADTPAESASLGRHNDAPKREDWHDIKVEVMREVILAKFLQNKDIGALLLDTGDKELIEDSPVDYFWGCGEKKTGKNMLGVVLMEVRDKLKAD